MRRFFSLFTMMMLCTVLSFAQSRVVSGRVSDANGKPVPFASVVIKGGGGIQADVNGEYQIRINPGDVLQISGTGFDVVEVPVGSLSSINTTLQLKENTIAEVVVTSAFGIKRTGRAQTSNAQNVNSDQLNTIRQQSLNDALAGKTAGSQVQSQSAAKLGADTKIRLRGENGIVNGGGNALDNGSGALYVVDGTIVTNSNDINMDDIEDVSVLQGPAASALFGAQGVNGAIVVNTKKAKRGQRGIGLEINSNVTFDKVYIMPNYQNEYAGGNDAVLHKYTYEAGVHPAAWAVLDGKYYHDYQEDVSWGPRMAGQEYIPWYSWYGGHERAFTTAKLNAQPNNARNFFNTGKTTLNNVAFTKGGDDYSFRMAYTNLDQEGLVPNSWLKRNNFSTSFRFDLSSKFTVGANVNYVIRSSNSENDDGYSNNTTGTFNQWFHRDLDMGIMKELAGLKNEFGQLASWNHSNPSNYDPAHPTDFYRPYYWFSPVAWQYQILNQNNRNRLYGDAYITYKPSNDLSFKLTYRKNILNTSFETRQYNALAITNAGNNLAGFNYWELISGRSAMWQGYAFGSAQNDRRNIEFLTSYNKKIRDFAVGANVGFDLMKANVDQTRWNSLGGLTVPDEFMISNSVKVNPHSRRIDKSGYRAVFARADVGYKNMIYLDGSYRWDYFSSETKGFGTRAEPIQTKSIGAAVVVSDLLKLKSDAVTYIKLRGSIGQIVNSLDPYQNTVLYDPTGTYPTPYNGSVRFLTEPNVLVNPSLTGSNNNEKEIGLEMRFLKNRVSLNATLWNRTNKDFPFDVQIYGGTGYTVLSTNSGELTKKGVEIQLGVIPVRKANFDWNINATFGRIYENNVIEIADGLLRTPAISNGQAGTNAYVVNEVGMRWGQLIGKTKLLNENGVPVLNSDGLHVLDPELKHFGSVLPMYTGGIQNSFTIFKNFVANVNIDYSYGGKFFSLSRYYGSATGLMAETAVLNDRGHSIRDEVADGGGVHVVGVDETGKAVDTYVNARSYFEQFAYGQGIVDPFIEDLTFVKLRELSIGYKLPVERMGISKYVKNATFSIVSRNPWLIYAKAKGFDPSEISTNYGEDGQLPGTRSMGFNLKIGF